DIPEHIIEKLEDGKISLTHFSDILRMNLIAYNGGFWVDATIFCSKKVEEAVFENPIYTGRNPGKDFKNISNWDWTGFAIAGWKGNSLFVAANAIFSAYWDENDVLIDYYLIDYVLRMVYENIPEVKATISQIKPNNTEQMHLCHNLNSPYSEEGYQSIVTRSTWLHKLSWKEKWNEKTSEGEKTMYAHWKEQVEEQI
ncbi:capsular polysaccharide synthesis protein, partial [Faecalicatena contorta]|uniref:capsular polysaccharide synthesis protein n=1 Tax=Faecalicatena contorta TaxID=39482 RepID=UPI001F483427